MFRSEHYHQRKVITITLAAHPMGSQASKAISGPALFTSRRYINSTLIEVEIYPTVEPKQFLFRRETSIFGAVVGKDSFDTRQRVVTTEEYVFETVNGSKSQEAIIAGLRKYRHDHRHRFTAAEELVNFDFYAKE
jgi:hypothetical protein